MRLSLNMRFKDVIIFLKMSLTSKHHLKNYFIEGGVIFMGYYKFCIVKHEKNYHFALYPNNNNKQALGLSNPYSSNADAEEGLYQFKQFVKLNSLILSNYLTIHKENKKYHGKLNYEKGHFIQPIGYEKESEYKKWLERIIKNIDAPKNK